MSLKYIEVKDDKSPVTYWKEEKNQFSDFSSLPNAALIVPENIVVVDFDGDNISKDGKVYDSKIVNDILNQVPTYWTSSRQNHYHLFFKIPKGISIKSNSDVLTCGGFQVDYKTTGSYVIIKMNNQMREATCALTSEVMDRIPELPSILYPLKKNSDGTKFIGLRSHDGRNDLVFRHAVLLRKKYPSLDIKESLLYINDCLFKEGLSDKELNSIIASSVNYTNKSDNEINNLIYSKTEIICLADVEKKDAKWIWYPYIPIGALVILAGDPGIGKSYLSLYIASKLSNGGDFPFSDKSMNSIKKPVNVLVQNGEDAIDYTLKKRIEILGGNSENIYIIDESETSFHVNNVSVLEEFIKEYNLKLLVIDPIQQYLGRGTDMHRANDVRANLAPLKELAEKYQCTILLIMHRNKNKESNGLYRALGSVDFVACCRSMLSAIKEDGNTFIVHEKNSLGPKGKKISYVIDENGISFNDFISEEDLKMEKHIKAKEIIKSAFLTSKTIPSNELNKLAQDNNISNRLLNRIRQELNINAFQQNKQWYCCMEDDNIIVN